MRLPSVFRENGPALAAAAVIAVLIFGAVRWILTHQDRPTAAPRKVVTLTGAVIKPPEPLKPTAPPPPPVVKPKQIDEPQRNRVEIKSTDIPPSATPPPQNAPGGGRLSLAAEATGEGDAFNLVGNPGGRGLLSGGGLGDGIGGGVGSGTGSRYAWYYSKIAAQLEEELRKSKRLGTAEARVELRIWTDSSGRITRVQLIRSTGNKEIDEAIQSVVGLRLRDPPPADIPMPMIARVTARRPG